MWTLFYRYLVFYLLSVIIFSFRIYLALTFEVMTPSSMTYGLCSPIKYCFMFAVMRLSFAAVVFDSCSSLLCFWWTFSLFVKLSVKRTLMMSLVWPKAVLQQQQSTAFRWDLFGVQSFHRLFDRIRLLVIHRYAGSPSFCKINDFMHWLIYVEDTKWTFLLL